MGISVQILFYHLVVVETSRVSPTYEAEDKVFKNDKKTNVTLLQQTKK